jgi:hypothetical protein
MDKMRYFLAAMPFIISFGGWKLSVVLAEYFGCAPVPNKGLNPCFVGSVDIGPALDAFSWWGMLLWMPCLLISGLAIGKVLAKSLQRPWGSHDRRAP